MRAAVNNFHVGAKQRIIKRCRYLAYAAAGLNGVFLAAAYAVGALPAELVCARADNRIEAPFLAGLDGVAVYYVRRLLYVELAVLLYLVVPAGGKFGGIAGDE